MEYEGEGKICPLMVVMQMAVILVFFLSHKTGMILRLEEAHWLLLIRKNPLKGGKKFFQGAEEVWV